MKLSCKTCGKPLAANTRKLIARSSGYCLEHANKQKWSAESRAKLAATLEKKWARRLADPAERAAAVESGKRLRAATVQSDELVAKQIAGRRRSFWVPEGYDEFNRQLKQKGFPAAERKAIILAEVEGTPEHARRTVANHIDAQRIRQERDRAQAY